MRKKPKIHFIGIGGIGMSGIARMYLSRGYAVSGSDIKRSEICQTLERMGAEVHFGHDAAHVGAAELVVYSSSIPEDHPERRAAAATGIRIMHRAEALAELCRDKHTIAVTGTHGKTTTTALIGTLLKGDGRDPSVVVGGLVLSLGGNAYVGRGPDMVIEADESDSSFLKFSPAIEVITNIEAEHMDHFQTMGRIEEAYRAFIARLPKDGRWVGCAEDPRVRALAEENIRPSDLYGFEKTAWVRATDIIECPGGRRGVSFKVWKGQECLGQVDLRILGRHNVLNALAAVCVGLRMGLSFGSIARSLAEYEGAARRFDVRYEDADFLVVDDYAHHPTEIQKTLAAASAVGRRRIFAIFQPHRYSRVKTFLDEFAHSFSQAEQLIVTDIYAAGEDPEPGYDGPRMAAAIRQAGHPSVTYVPRHQIEDHVLGAMRAGDLLICLGAGDIYHAADRIGEILSRRRHTGTARAAGQRPARIFEDIRGKVVREELLAKHTTLRIGGPAEFWIEPEDTEDLSKALSACRQNGVAVRVLGAGSNILAPDAGVRGAVIHLGASYWKRVQPQPDGTLLARSGVPNTLFIQAALDAGYGGCEFLQGIPGNVGGAIAMNAGSHGQSVDEVLVSIRAMRFDGTPVDLARGDIAFSYRQSGLKDLVIIEGLFRLPFRDRAEVQKKLDEYREYRARTQDLHHPSAGCMFKNPAGVDCSSGKMIEDAGFKGRTVGRAQISTKHANYIINLGGASSFDVITLIGQVRDAVKQKFGVDLETEVKFL